MYVSELNNGYEVQENKKVFGTKALKKPEKEEDTPLVKETYEESRKQREDSIEISLEGRLAASGQNNATQQPAVSVTEKEADEGLSDTKETADEGVTGAEETTDKGVSDAEETVDKDVSGAEETMDEDVSDAEETTDEDVSEKQSGKVAVNEGKRARQIAAAQSQAQVQQVLALLQKDLSDCKAGLEKGWCDKSEIAKVEALMSKAKARMSQVPLEADQENSQGGLNAFDMASLM